MDTLILRSTTFLPMCHPIMPERPQGWGRQGAREGGRPHLETQFFSLYGWPLCYFFSMWGALCYVLLFMGAFFAIFSPGGEPFFVLKGGPFFGLPPPPHESFCERPCNHVNKIFVSIYLLSIFSNSYVYKYYRRYVCIKF